MGLSPPAEPAVSCTHFLAAGSVEGPLKKSPVLGLALLRLAVPLTRLTPVDVVVLFGVPSVLLPSGVTANHVPPTPWPLVWPGAVSLAKRYTGQPPRVTWSVPSPRSRKPTSVC